MPLGQDLATRFEQANNDFIRAVEACSDAAWQRTSAAEGWTADCPRQQSQRFQFATSQHLACQLLHSCKNNFAPLSLLFDRAAIVETGAGLAS